MSDPDTIKALARERLVSAAREDQGNASLARACSKILTVDGRWKDVQRPVKKDPPADRIL